MSSIHRIIRAAAVAVGAVALAAFAIAPAAEAGTNSSFIGQFHKIKTVASTVPGNGDVNPYGVAVVPSSVGSEVKGDVLVSNFNNSGNAQGTGTTIVQVSPGGQQTVFAQINASALPGRCPGGVGLTTALGILPGGWVVVGSLPTSDGTSATAQAGCLLVINNQGQVAETIAGHGINGPWDMATVSAGPLAALFVSNVLNGTVAAGGATVNQGTVERLVLALRGNKPPQLIAHTIIGSGFGEHTDPAALVVGPTGLGLNSQGTLFVADSVGNRITAIPGALVRFSSAGTGNVVTSNGHLNTPLGLAIAPNGDVLTVNAGDGFIVETTPAGHQIAKALLDKTVSGTPPSPPGAGALFGLAVTPNANGIYYVDDAVNTLNLFH
jgi:hypothetical protein